MLTPGTMHQGYKVEALLQRSAGIAIFRISHAENKQIRLLKVFESVPNELRDRLIKRARNWLELNHTNIVRLYQIIDVEGVPGLVIEWIQGPPLHQFVEERKPDLNQILEIFDRILEGLAVAHARGIVHGNLKPGNILMEGKRPRITDFGIDMRLNPAYLAPEQLQNGHVTQRSDIFGLGCLLYEMLCGVPPFTGLEEVPGEYLSPHYHRPELPDRITQIIRTCLKSDPQQRPRDCAELQRLLGGGEPMTEEAPRPHIRVDALDEETITSVTAVFRREMLEAEMSRMPTLQPDSGAPNPFSQRWWDERWKGLDTAPIAPLEDPEVRPGPPPQPPKNLDPRTGTSKDVRVDQAPPPKPPTLPSPEPIKIKPPDSGRWLVVVLVLFIGLAAWGIWSWRNTSGRTIPSTIDRERGTNILPIPSAPASGKVRVKGDATATRLINSSGESVPIGGAIPAGSYTLEATFATNDGAIIRKLNISIDPGETAIYQCSTDAQSCARQ